MSNFERPSRDTSLKLNISPVRNLEDWEPLSEEEEEGKRTVRARFVERVENDLAERQRRLESKKALLLMQEKLECPFKPSICRKQKASASRRDSLSLAQQKEHILAGSTDHDAAVEKNKSIDRSPIHSSVAAQQQAWMKKREERIKMLREKKQEKVVELHEYKHHILPKSKQIVDEMIDRREYLDAVHGWKVRQKEHGELMEALRIHHQPNFSPSILLSSSSSMARSMQSSASTFDRLYVDASSRSTKAAKRIEESYKAKTPRAISRKPKESLEHVVSMNERSAEAKQKTQDAELQRRGRENRVVKHLNANTENLAEQHRRREALKILLKKEKKGWGDESPESEEEVRSRQSAVKIGPENWFQFFERNDAFKDRQRRSKEMVEEEREAEYKRHCTFSPQITTRSRQIPFPVYDMHSGSSGDED